MIPETVQQQRDLDREVAQFEGLVHETARQIVEAGVELELDDVRQLLRIKVLYAVQRYQHQRSALPLRRFVFGAVMNVRKDIETRRPRRFNSSIDSLREEYETSKPTPTTYSRADSFDAQYLSISAEEVFFEVEDEDPPWISRLSCIERQVVRLRAEGLTMSEIDLELGLGHDRARFVMQSVRAKLGGCRDRGADLRSAPMPPLPGAAPQTARPQLLHAA